MRKFWLTLSLSFFPLLSWANVNDNLTHYYKLDETSGDRIDLIDSFNLSSLGSVGSVSGKIDNAVELSGSSNQLVGDDVLSANSLSVSFWVKMYDSSSDYEIITDRTGTGGFIDWHVVYKTSDALQVYRDVPGGSSVMLECTSVDLTDDFHHIAFTYNDSSYDFLLYIDGSLCDSDTATGSGASGGTFLKLSSNNTDYGSFMNGIVDELAIWDRELDVTEIELLSSGCGYISSLCAEGGLSGEDFEILGTGIMASQFKNEVVNTLSTGVWGFMALLGGTFQYILLGVGVLIIFGAVTKAYKR